MTKQAKIDNNLIYFAVQVYIKETKQKIHEMRYSRNPQAFKDEMTAKYEETLAGLEVLYATMGYKK